MSVIECKGLSKVFGHAKALNNLSCSIEENKITGLIGRNGAGKTTLLNMIAGHLKPTSGEIKVFSETPFNNLTVSANLIFIHDQMNLPTALNLKEILETGSNFYENWDHEHALRLFEYFHLNPRQYYADLSKGLKNTFNMIIGLAARCPLTIFDEPTLGMDAPARKDFYRALLKEYITYPRTFIISSHHLEEIEEILEDILLLQDGKELLHLPVTELNDWAIGLQGKTTLVEEWTQNKEVLYRKSMGPNHTYTVVRNNFSDLEYQKAKLVGMDILPVSSSDLCIYLTEKSKGGIDDVFNKA